MKNLSIQSQVVSTDYNSVQKVNNDVHILEHLPDGLYLLDANANILDKNADSYPEGTIKAFGYIKNFPSNLRLAMDVTSVGPATWGDTILIPDIATTTTSYIAQEDREGEHNTDQILNQEGYSFPIAEACRLRTFNGKSGYLPSAGELRYGIFLLREELNSLITKFNLEPLDSTLWVSTQYNDKRAWSVSWETGQVANLPRSSSLTSRAFFVW